MQRALVAVRPTKLSERLVREAGELAAGVDAEIILMSTIPTQDYEKQRRALAEIRELDSGHSIEQAEEALERATGRLARKTFTDLDVSYELVGKVGREVRGILAEAKERDCDHIFLTGRRRSPTGKAVFGDATQSVLLNFDGPATVLLGPEDE